MPLQILPQSARVPARASDAPADLATERTRADALQRQLQLASADVREMGARLAAAQLEAAAASGGESAGAFAHTMRALFFVLKQHYGPRSLRPHHAGLVLCAHHAGLVLSAHTMRALLFLCPHHASLVLVHKQHRVWHQQNCAFGAVGAVPTCPTHDAVYVRSLSACTACN